MADYVYPDESRPDIYRMIPPDGSVLGIIGHGGATTEAQLVSSICNFHLQGR